MANLYDGSATGALNEDAYINKLYDTTLESQKKALREGYEATTEQVDAGKQQVQEQTADYLKRSYAENDRASAAVGADTAANPQAALTMNNQQQRNTTVLRNQQGAADQEFERQRQVLADRYASQIKQAQANNDMQRAQALYEAAKAEEVQLRALRESAGKLMYEKGDNSILNTIGSGAVVTPDTTTPTWDGVLKNEEAINKIYDAQLESQRLQAEQAMREGISDAQAQQEQSRRETDKNLTQAYVDALKRGQNYRETQTAYGQSSGTAAQAQLAREAGLTKELTDLRTLQLAKDAQAEQQKLGLVDAYRAQNANARADIDLKRAQALYDAAEGEEQALMADQQMLGQLLAKGNDYSVLGKLYGLTPDQIARLQGTGVYAQRPRRNPDDGDETGQEDANVPETATTGASGGGSSRILRKAYE